ncbi:MAG: hypothetical protein IPH88_19215 [Bacteroidales bacterium]|nr:hypothetical protein [Bacteroidales bacterium]
MKSVTVKPVILQDHTPALMQLVFPVISRIIILQQARTTLHYSFQPIASNVTILIRDGVRQNIKIMIPSHFPFILELIKENGIIVPTVIQILPIMLNLPAPIAMSITRGILMMNMKELAVTPIIVSLVLAVIPMVREMAL